MTTQFRLEKTTCTNIPPSEKDYWPRVEESREAFDAVIEAVVTPIDQWPKTINFSSCRLANFLSKGWKLYPSKDKNWFYFEMCFQNRSVITAEGKYKVFPPPTAIIYY